MSYDVDLCIDTGGESPVAVCEVGNITYNVAPMFRKALDDDGLNSLNGCLAADCIHALECGVSHISHPANRATYLAMNPSNGWGDHGGATRFLQSLLDACRAHPKATVRVS